jgi:hypothetical protein
LKSTAEQAAHAREEESKNFLFVGPTGSRPLLVAFFWQAREEVQPIFFFLSRGEVSFRERRGKEEEEEGPRRFIQKLGESSAHQTKNTRERKSSQQKKNNAEEVWFLSHDERSHRAVLSIKTSLIILYLYKVNVA